MIRRVSLCAASVALAAGSVALSADDFVQERGMGHGHHRRSANLFAVVDTAGTLVSGGGVSGVTHLATGQYEVTFTRDVSACAYLATTANAYSQALQAYTAGGHLSGRGVYVETKNQGGGLTDGPFHLVVTCGGLGAMYAVVDYSGDLVRSTRGTTVTSLGPGSYEVKFPWSFHHGVAPCAYLATVGDPANELVYNPSGVYTSSGPDWRTVRVETKNPGGGLQDGVPFHLAVVCPSAPKTQVAVVGANGLLNRGSVFMASFKGAPGKYTLVTNRDVSACATVATRGSVDGAVPYFPTTVEVIAGPAPNTVGLDVRNLLYFGDTPRDESFHAAIVCK